MFKNFPEQWQDLLKEKGITTETAIQKELFAPITEGDNILGISPTGTGKTLAYLLPLLLSLKPKKIPAIAYPSTQFRACWTDF